MSDQGYTSNAEQVQRRRERAAIAAQACETCRTRKSKCDERRPKCGLCTRLGVECKYREAQPTKKDKTLVHILDSLQRLETKIDSISQATTGSGPSQPILSHENHENFGLPAYGGLWSPVTHSSHTTPSEKELRPQKVNHPAARTLPATRSSTISRQELEPETASKRYSRVTAAQKLLLWPAIGQCLQLVGVGTGTDLQALDAEGVTWLVNLEQRSSARSLPSAGPDVPRLSQGIWATSGRHTQFFPDLPPKTIDALATRYFDTFNLQFPLLDRGAFFTRLLPIIRREGFGLDDPQSVIALLVLALGKLGYEGVYGEPISYHNQRASGVKGGTSAVPPGLEMFNEARKRMGFNMTECNLENVQAFSLAGLYYAACCRPMEFWRTAVTASMACQVLLKSKLRLDWSTYEADQIKRVYWHCVIIEDALLVELDLPPSGIRQYQDDIPLPQFIGPFGHDDTPDDHTLIFRYYYLAQISIRRLCARVHSTLYNASDNGDPEGYGGPPVTVIRELSHQLDSWRSLLPQALQWDDDKVNEMPAEAGHTRTGNFLTPEQGPASSTSAQVPNQYELDMVVSHLRTRFYFTRYLIYRPFLYKALHFPSQMTPADIECCVVCLKSCLSWPILRNPPREKKRLVPFLFTWPQTFLGILILLHMTRENELLRFCCEKHFTAEELEQTAGLMLDFVRDLAQICPISSWSMDILKPLYGGFG